METREFSKGNRLFREGKLEAAVTAYKNAIEQNPGFYLYHQNLGDTLGKLGHFKEAIAAYNQAVALNPEASWSHFQLSRSLQQVILVIIPAFNAELTIKDSLYSVLNQTHKYIKTIVVDDCSSDRTFKILQKEKGKHLDLEILRLPKNVGTYNAVNYGLFFASNVKKMNFDFFTIHGADDLMVPEKLETQLKDINKNNVLASMAGYTRVDYNTERKIKYGIGHSMVLYSKQVFEALGYYDDTRFGGDSEYIERFKSFYGSQNLSILNQNLTRAYYLKNRKNLTKSTPETSRKRERYINTFQINHIEMKKQNNFYIDLCADREIINQILAISNSKSFHLKVKSSEQVICGIATVLERKEALRDTVISILPQVHKLIVYQNGYKEKFGFLNNDKIEVISSLDTGINMGDAGKFYKINNFPNCYYISIDDDLIYPKNFVSNIIRALKKYDNKIIVTHHGRILKKNPKLDHLDYYFDRLSVYRCLGEVPSENFVHFGGTGVMGFHTNIVKINFNYFQKPNMADIWMGLYARENNIPILVLPHKAGWIQYNDRKLDANKTIYRKYEKQHKVQNNLIKKFDTSRIVKFHKVAFLTCTFGRPSISKIFKQNLLKLQSHFSNKYDFINLVIDSENSNRDLFDGDPRFEYYNHENWPLSNKWNFGVKLLQNMNFDYVFIIGSDDIIDKNVFKVYDRNLDRNPDLIGILDMYIFDIQQFKSYYLPGYPKKHYRFGEPLGLGRCLSKKMLEYLNYQLWEDGLNKGLDLSMMKRIKALSNRISSVTFNIKDVGIACDIKSGDNVTKIEEFSGKIQEITDKNISDFIQSLILSDRN